MLVIRIVVKIVGVLLHMCNWSEFQKLQVCNSIYPGQYEAQRSKLVKNNYAAIPNILQQQNIKETSVHRSDTDAVTTTEAPPVRVKQVGSDDGARCLCFFLVALACENDSSHFSLLLLRNNTFFRYFGKNLPKINI